MAPITSDGSYYDSVHDVDFKSQKSIWGNGVPVVTTNTNKMFFYIYIYALKKMMCVLVSGNLQNISLPPKFKKSKKITKWK